MPADAAMANSFFPSLKLPSLSGVFNFAVKAAGWLAIGLASAVLFDPITLTLGHFNAGGMAVIQALDPYFQSFYDWSGMTDGLKALAGWLGNAPADMAQRMSDQIVNNVLVPT